MFHYLFALLCFAHIFTLHCPQPSSGWQKSLEFHRIFLSIQILTSEDAAAAALHLYTIVTHLNKPEQSMARERTECIVRPTTQEDAEKVNALLKIFYQTMLPNDYDPTVLNTSLPLMAKANPELLTSGTWFIVEHPQVGTVAGCGGWTPLPPRQTWAERSSFAPLCDSSQFCSTRRRESNLESGMDGCHI